jgi:acyl carrier protein
MGMEQFSERSKSADLLEDLRLTGDLDDVEMLQEVEKVFDIKISDEEAAELHSVGDLFELLKSKLGTDVIAGKCRSAMAFYRLRRVVLGFVPGQKLRPVTEISSIGINDIRAFFGEVKSRTGLEVPNGVAAVRYELVAALIFAASAFLAIFGGLLLGKYVALAALVIAALTLAYFRFAPLVWKSTSLTMGTFAEKVAAKNHAKLSVQGARSSVSDVWKSLILVLAENVEAEADKIAPSTAFFPKKPNGS